MTSNAFHTKDASRATARLQVSAVQKLHHPTGSKEPSNWSTMRLSFLDLVAKFGKGLSDERRIGRRSFSGTNYEVETDRQIGL
jgi:hypothetical protein